MRLLLALTAYGFYVTALGGLTAPFVARAFGLGDAGITAVSGWMALGAFGTAVLTRLADRRGRRGVLLATFAGIPVLAAATVLARGVISYTLLQIGVTALLGALVTALAVAVTERAADERRAAVQAWFGVFAALGGAVALAIGAAVEALPGGWRAFWAAAALPAVAVPFVRARLLETERFARARDAGRIAATRGSDLFAGPYRQRALGLLLVNALRPIALTAISTWPYYHMVRTLGLSPASASLVYLVGGGLGLLGNPLGARMTDGWGRRPTSIAGTAIAVAAGVAFYWVPRGASPAALPALIALMAVNQIATSIFSLADRCIDTELFPTALRATYLGAARLMNAGAAVVTGFGLSALAGPLGGLPAAIGALSVATLLPALAIFAAVVPETRGLSLEQASLEERPATL